MGGDLANARFIEREGRVGLPDVPVDVELESIDANAQQYAGHRLREAADRIRRIGAGQDLLLDVGVAVVVAPRDVAVLENGGRQTGHPDLRNQGLDVSFEYLERKLFLGGPLPTRRHQGADGY